MKTIPPALQAHLDSGTTTVAWCWKIIRRDGLVQGFTNHDRDLTVAGVLYEASTGMLGSEIESSLGMSVDNLNVMGAVSSLSISEEDIQRGFYLDAAIEIYLVNWSNTAQYFLMKTGNIGEVKRGKTFFEAEVRGLATQLQQVQGRLYTYGCDAIVGDARCKVNLATASYTSVATISTTDGSSSMIVSGIDAKDSGWFSRGKITFTSGPNNGLTREIRAHLKSEGIVRIDLWEPTPYPISPTETISLQAGCDKTFKTCKAKFNNRLNFRGFPHMPGPNFVVSVVNANDINQDGGGNYVGAD